jgi:large subunit ribosomal protein L24
MSKKPSKERKALYNMPMHKAAKQVAAHLDEKLAKEFGKRSLTVRKGDTVKVMRGSFAGKEGKIKSVDRGARKIFIEKIVAKKSNGEERQVPIDASNVMLIDIERTDRKRIQNKAGVKK